MDFTRSLNLVGDINQIHEAWTISAIPIFVSEDSLQKEALKGMSNVYTEKRMY